MLATNRLPEARRFNQVTVRLDQQSIALANVKYMNKMPEPRLLLRQGHHNMRGARRIRQATNDVQYSQRESSRDCRSR